MRTPDAVSTLAAAGAPPRVTEELAFEPEAEIFIARPWQLMWRRFRRHRLAVVGLIVTALIVLVAILADFIAPVATDAYNPKYAFAPPQPLRLFTNTEAGFDWGLNVAGYTVTVDQVKMKRIFVVDEATRVPVGLFVKGSPYRLLGLIPTDVHFIGPADPANPMFLLGADRLGRDVFSRLVHGTRISISVGLVGVAFSLFLGVLLGGISGYYGGAVDSAIQRVIEFLQAIPSIPLWMGLSAAIPQTFSPIQVYFLITIILSVIGWTGLARVVRGRFLALKTEDFITAARLDGVGDMRIIMRHMVPSFSSHIIATVTLAIPGMILAETALSFLGIGLRPPVVSWGVLLQEAQNINSVASAPWLFWPGVAVIVTVLAFNFLGDGLRDAADPYA